MHYSRLKRTGKLGQAESSRGDLKICSVDNCNNKHLSRGFCVIHYRQLQMLGELGLCSVEGCKKRQIALNLCSMHYNRFKKSGETGETESRRPSRPKICSLEGCERGHKALGFCSMHYNRLKKRGEVGSPESENPPGRVWIQDGYRKTIVNGKHVLEHRLIMSQIIGRELTKEENVHHINGIRDDNSIDNLELWTTKQPKGKRVSDIIQFSLDILNIYGSNPENFRPSGGQS